MTPGGAGHGHDTYSLLQRPYNYDIIDCAENNSYRMDIYSTFSKAFDWPTLVYLLIDTTPTLIFFAKRRYR